MLLVAGAAAQENSVARPEWQVSDPIYARDEWPTCGGDDSQCADGYLCLKHMWTYDGEHSAEEGCWDPAVCSGTGAWWFYDEPE